MEERQNPHMDEFYDITMMPQPMVYFDMVLITLSMVLENDIFLEMFESDHPLPMRNFM